MWSRIRPATVGAMGAFLAVIMVPPPAAASPPSAEPTTPSAAAAASDSTSALERKRVDRVPAPKLSWYKCFGPSSECAVAKLPLDYDNPTGPKTDVGVLRVKARDQRHKIGTLFVNPGGPGGPATLLADAAPDFLADAVLDRFDIVGVDPRGVHSSGRVACFKDARDEARVLHPISELDFYPWEAREQRAYITYAKEFAKACSTTGKTMAGAVSTAEVVRDMDVIRRTLGDKRLTFLGFSYGSVIGQYYANMFPDRVRAIAVDGIIDPVSWVGTAQTGGQNQDERLRSADGAHKALRDLLVRCRQAGPQRCPFAAGDDPLAKLQRIIDKLRTAPIESNGAEFTYPTIGATLLHYLYLLGIQGYVDSLMETLDILDIATRPTGSVPAAVLAKAKRSLAQRIAKLPRAWTPRRDFPTENDYSDIAVICTDARHPKRAEDWPAQATRADQRAPLFGPVWAWGTAECAANTWTVRDEDAYTGPFNRRTSAPVLFVGNTWDPATNYLAAVSASKRLPASRLVSSDSWGHTAYGTSDCVNQAVDSYLVGQKLPPTGLKCTGDFQPFQPESTSGNGQLAAKKSPASTFLDPNARALYR
jgi:pimeloyl-ACP methyl ester carboxylesterase